MGRLAGFSADEVIRKPLRAGFLFDRHARGAHEIWRHPGSRARTTVPRHPGDLPEGTVAAIVKQAGLSVEAFLDL
jgi:predicted RNA binding protein YcfA (HicA-like mRNA interferase family)